MQWCEETPGIDYVFGFAGNDTLAALTREAADELATERALSGKERLRSFKAFRYGAKSWDKERRFVARIEATAKGLDVRYVVTSLRAGARHLYETIYCARGEPRRTSSSGTRASSPPIAPHAASRRPISSA